MSNDADRITAVLAERLNTIRSYAGEIIAASTDEAVRHEARMTVVLCEAVESSFSTDPRSATRTLLLSLRRLETLDPRRAAD